MRHSLWLKWVKKAARHIHAVYDIGSLQLSDLEQHAAGVIWSRLRQGLYNPQRCSLEGWIFGTARREMIDLVLTQAQDVMPSLAASRGRDPSTGKRVGPRVKRPKMLSLDEKTIAGHRRRAQVEATFATLPVGTERIEVLEDVQRVREALGLVEFSDVVVHAYGVGCDVRSLRSQALESGQPRAKIQKRYQSAMSELKGMLS